MPGVRNQDETLTSDRWLLIVSLGVSIAAFLLCLKFSAFVAVNSNLLREYHKTVITISAIFLAFSPAFFAFIYSNDNLKNSILSLKIKHSVNRYFKYSSLASLIFLFLSIVGVIAAYTEPQSKFVPKFISQNYVTINLVLFSSSIAVALNLIYWSVLFGQLVISIVNRVVR